MAKHISYYLDDLKKRLFVRKNKPKIEIKSIPSLNSKLWGIQEGKVYVIGARTSNGKSAFVLQLAMDIGGQGYPVLMLSLEMETLQILERAFSYHSKVDNMDLLKGKFENHLHKYDQFTAESKDINLVIEDSIGKTWEQIDEYLNKLSVKPSVVIIDHIHEVKRSENNERGMIDEYIRRFKEMAIRHNFAAIICAQINRMSASAEDKRPEMHQLKSSGYLEEAADVCILLHYPFKMRKSTNENHFEVYVDKNRNGRTGYLRLHYEPQFYSFFDVAEEPKMKENYQQEYRERVDWDA